GLGLRASGLEEWLRLSGPGAWGLGGYSQHVVAAGRLARQEEIDGAVPARKIVLKDRADGEPPLERQRRVVLLQPREADRNFDEQTRRVQPQIRGAWRKRATIVV